MRIVEAVFHEYEELLNEFNMGNIEKSQLSTSIIHILIYPISL